MPTFFAQLYGVTALDVRAQAKATSAPANVATCLWPLAIPDTWTEVSPVDGNFTNMVDTYTRPLWTTVSNTTGTGYRLNLTSKTYETALTLTQFPPAQYSTPGALLAPSMFVPVQVPRATGGGFVDNLTTCNGLPVAIGDTLALDGSGSGAQVISAAAARVAQDAGTTWNSTQHIVNSCARIDPPCAAYSPRHVAIAVFDPQVFETTRLATGTPEIRIVNFVGFYIEQSSPVRGQLFTFPGRVDPSKPQVPFISAGLRSAVLVR